MPKHPNIGLFLKNTADKKYIIEQILENKFLIKYLDLNNMNGGLYSSVVIERLLDEEMRHDRFVIKTVKNQGLNSMSSGERKKALLNHLISLKPHYLILDDIYSNIDIQTQKAVKEELKNLGDYTIFVQLFYRKEDVLPAIEKVLFVDENNRIEKEQDLERFLSFHIKNKTKITHLDLPESYHESHSDSDILVELRSVSASYGTHQVLNNINWTIKKNEFWQLAGPNGSGKSTLVSMITGDNPFGYGQELYLFARRKGTGESIWDIKQKIGYFTPAIISRFNHNDSVENMIVSGFKDSVGLYSKASNMEKRIADRWIEILGMSDRKQKFRQLSVGQQRMIMVARAMVKHPPLLILDEPTIELDDENSILFVELIHAIRKEKDTAVIYISHREEKRLKPDKIFELVPSDHGYTGEVRK